MSFLRRLFQRRKRALGLITSERLPPSVLTYDETRSLFNALEGEFDDDELGPLLVLDFLRRDLLIPSERFANTVLALAQLGHESQTLNALWFLHERAAVAEKHGVRLALTRTDVWNGVIETNMKVYLDS